MTAVWYQLGLDVFLYVSKSSQNLEYSAYIHSYSIFRLYTPGVSKNMIIENNKREETEKSPAMLSIFLHYINFRNERKRRTYNWYLLWISFFIWTSFYYNYIKLIEPNTFKMFFRMFYRNTTTWPWSIW